MPSAIQAVLAKLLADSTVTALVGSRIYPSIAPEIDPAYPRIIFSPGDASYPVASDGPVGLASKALVAVVVAEAYGDQRGVSDAVIESLHGHAGTWGSGSAETVVQGCFLEDEAEDEVSGAGTEDQLRYENRLTFTVWFETS